MPIRMMMMSLLAALITSTLAGLCPVKKCHQNITAADLCEGEAERACAATSRVLNFPTITTMPSFAWNFTATLPADITNPTFDVAAVVSHPSLPQPYNVHFGFGSGAACDSKQVRVGIGAKGNKSPIPCPDCHVALKFPSCPDGWKKGPFLIEGQFNMSYFLLLGIDRINVTVAVRSDEGSVLALRHLADPQLDDRPAGTMAYV
jgi:hypothetical protein